MKILSRAENKMDVSIIIVNYNTSKLLSECLHTIRQHTHCLEYEVIVVDNDSKDNSRDMIKKDFPWVRLIESPTNLGFGGANNLGMKAANGKYFFLLNSDTLLRNNAIKYFFDFAENGNSDTVLGCILLSSDHKPCHSYGNFITPQSELKQSLARFLPFLKDKTNLHPPTINQAIETEYITGADLWIPKKIYERVGGFDEDFFMYCEEVDWQLRMHQNGIRRLIIPGPEIIHLEGGSDKSVSSIWSASRLGRLYKSKRLYHKKHFGKGFKYRIFRMLYLMLNTPAILLLSVMKPGQGYTSLLNNQ